MSMMFFLLYQNSCWSQSAPLLSVGSDYELDKWVCQFGVPIYVYHVTRQSRTVDVVSHGRLDFGIGAGWYEHEYRAYGYDYPDVSERLRALHEAVQVILAMWTQEEARFEGSYYQVRGAINQPKGMQQPHIPLLIGGSGEQVTLKLVAQYADACNITNPDIATLERKLAILKNHCEAFGRDYESIKRTVLLMCAIAETDEQAALKIGAIERDAQGQADLSRIRERALIGTPETIRRRLAAYEQAGAQEIIVYIPDAATLESVQLFARTCMGT
jgi:alkanesulfonate monooxygenase SsuD/methylene tetrahydromethanopterin reductase-like flavin-dependent oxidoreductase (luciferase family)